MDSNNYIQAYEQTERFTCLKNIAFISFAYSLTFAIIFLVYYNIYFLVICISFLLRCLDEIFILSGIILKDFGPYNAGTILCYFLNIYDTLLIIGLLIVVCSSISNEKDLIYLAIIILTAIKIYIEFFVYACNSDKFKKYFNRPLNVQPNNDLNPPSENIGNQNIDSPILPQINNQDNQDIINNNPLPVENIDNEDVVYTITSPVENEDTKE